MACTHPGHADLAERVIRAEAQARILSTEVREMQELHGEDPNASYTTALLSRIAVLEQNIARLTERRKAPRAA